MDYTFEQFRNHPDYHVVNPILESFRNKLDVMKQSNSTGTYEVSYLRINLTAVLRQTLDPVITTDGTDMPAHYLLRKIIPGYYNSDKNKWADFCYVYARTFQSVALDPIIADYEDKDLKPFELVQTIQLGKFDR